MRVPLEWLKEYVTVRLSPEELAHRLTMAGSEVTGIARVNGGPVLDFEITPNRADCLSIVGIAREVAAITGAKLKLPEGAGGGRQGAWVRKLPRPSPLAPRPAIRIEDRKGCRRYIGRLLEGVRLGPSPAWMQRRLAACGLRPINNVVDITNYVLLEQGQPLHAFDFEELGGGAIVVRRAKPGERLVAIDGTECVLSPEMLVIADAAQPVAVAGVMGGRDTQVHEHTATVLLESAEFDPLVVRRAARRLGLASASSYRFERGVDPRAVAAASARAAQLIEQLAGGRQTAVLDVGARASSPVVVRLEPARIPRWLGAPIPPPKAQQALQRLGLSVRKGATQWRVSVPSFRRDLTQEVDLLEEIARIVGYERLPDTMPSAPLVPSRKSGPSSYEAAQRLRETCAGLGLSEIITWSLVSEGELRGLPQPPTLRLANPLSQDHVILRPTLLPGMVQAVSRNVGHGAHGVRFFELGTVFGSSGLREARHLSIGLTGFWEWDWQQRQEAGLFRLKGLVEALAARICGRALEARAASVPWAEPGQAMALALGGNVLGAAGQVARRIAEPYDLDKPVWFAELDADALLAYRPPARAVRPLSQFPPVKRDLSFLVDKQVEAATLLALIREAGSPLAERVELIDRFSRHPSIPPAKHSLTVSIEYRDAGRTLTAAEVDAVHRKIGETLTSRFGAQLR